MRKNRGQWKGEAGRRSGLVSSGFATLNFPSAHIPRGNEVPILFQHPNLLSPDAGLEKKDSPGIICNIQSLKKSVAIFHVGITSKQGILSLISSIISNLFNQPVTTHFPFNSLTIIFVYLVFKIGEREDTVSKTCFY